MNIVYLLVPMAIALSGFFLWAYFWATKSGQWDDLDMTPFRVMFSNGNRNGSNGEKDESKQ